MNKIKESSCLTCKNISTCFQYLTKEELNDIDKNRVSLNFKKGGIIAKQGAFATHIIFVRTGLVKLFREADSDENNLIINIFSAGNIIGLSSLYGDNTFNYSVSAIETSNLCLIEINIIRELVRKNGDFAVAVVTRLSKNNLLAYEILYSITHKQLNGKMASALIYLAIEVYNSTEFKLSLTRKELAEFTGMSVMSVVRTIKEFKKSGIISDENNHIKILNMNMLQNIKNYG